MNPDLDLNAIRLQAVALDATLNLLQRVEAFETFALTATDEQVAAVTAGLREVFATLTTPLALAHRLLETMAEELGATLVEEDEPEVEGFRYPTYEERQADRDAPA